MEEDYGKLHRGGDTLASLEGYRGAQQLGKWDEEISGRGNLR